MGTSDRSKFPLTMSHSNFANLISARSELDARQPEVYPFCPHITVSKELYDEVKRDQLTPKELNLKIDPLELRLEAIRLVSFTPE